MGRTIVKSKTSDFNISLPSSTQMTAVRVLDVILDINHPQAEALGFYDALGTIFYTKLNEETPLENPYDASTAKPIFSFIKNYPLKNEIVLILGSKGKAYDKNAVTTYYLPTLNMWNHPHHNALPSLKSLSDSNTTQDYNNAENGMVYRQLEDQSTDIDLGQYFIEQTNIKPLLPYEGDSILEGRFGNSIRLGATSTNVTENDWSKGGNAQDGDPIIIIRNGQNEEEDSRGWVATLENVNNDPSSIYLTSNQSISNLQVASTHAKSYTAKLIIPVDPMRVFAGDIPAPVTNEVISETSHIEVTPIVDQEIAATEEVIEEIESHEPPPPTPIPVTSDEMTPWDELFESGDYNEDDIDYVDWEDYNVAGGDELIEGCEEENDDSGSDITNENNPQNDNQPTPILGCTDPNADNYDPNATQDDGSCIYDAGPVDNPGGTGDSNSSNTPSPPPPPGGGNENTDSETEGQNNDTFLEGSRTFKGYPVRVYDSLNSDRYCDIPQPEYPSTYCDKYILDLQKNPVNSNKKYLVIHTTATSHKLIAAEIVEMHMHYRQSGKWRSSGYQHAIQHDGRIAWFGDGTCRSGRGDAWTTPGWGGNRGSSEGWTNTAFDEGYGGERKHGPTTNTNAIHFNWIGGADNAVKTGTGNYRSKYGSPEDRNDRSGPYGQKMQSYLNITRQQAEAVNSIIVAYIKKYRAKGYELVVCGHNDVAAKNCPWWNSYTHLEALRKRPGKDPHTGIPWNTIKKKNIMKVPHPGQANAVKKNGWTGGSSSKGTIVKIKDGSPRWDYRYELKMIDWALKVADPSKCDPAWEEIPIDLTDNAKDTKVDLLVDDNTWSKKKVGGKTIKRTEVTETTENLAFESTNVGLEPPPSGY
jgi:hypothetical protein